MADGSAFSPEAWYNVALTSYRSSGGGDTVILGAGIPKEETDARVVARYPEIREMVYQYIKKHGTVDPVLIGDRSVIGEWHFEPEKLVAPLMAADMELLF